LKKEGQRAKQRLQKESEKGDKTKLMIPKGASVMLLEKGEMLNDTHIDVANQMLRKQFPEVRGVQLPLLGQSLSFTEPPFVQVLHVNGDHWVTVIGVNSSLVKVYDSVFNTVGTSLALQTATILRTKSDIVLEVERTQFQLGKVEWTFCYCICHRILVW
jgi:hypothetical protein